MPIQFNHMFSIAFTIIDPSPTGENLPPATIRQAILARLAGLVDNELHEAIGLPEDSYEITEDLPGPEEERRLKKMDG